MFLTSFPVKTLDDKANYWTIGRYDDVVIMGAPNEKVMLKSLMRRGWARSETLVIIQLFIIFSYYQTPSVLLLACSTLSNCA